MLKLISRLFIVIGLFTLSIGVFHLWNSSHKEKSRLSEAHAMLSMNDEISKEMPKQQLIEIKYDKGETIGILYIPKLDREIPIIEGTDEDELSQGVGHFTDTGFPGQNRQILLSGHRDTVFRNFDQLEHGDEFHVKMGYGTYIYTIKDHEIVGADDTTVIDPSRKDEYLTVSTCYPFTMIGNAPDRYVLYAFPNN